MFDLIRQGVNIVRHVEKYTQLKQSGRTLHGKCPLHEDDTPSFVVYPEENSFFCFGCNRGGSVIDFEVYRQNISPLDATKGLCDEYNLHPTPADSFRYQQQLQIRKKKESWLEALTDSFSGRLDIYEYVKNRGLSDATIKTFQIGAGGSSNVVVIPINDKFGKIAGFARRNLDKDAKEKYLNDASDMVYNKSEILYNFDRAKKYARDVNAIILNEGYFDVASLWEAGIKNGVAFCSSRITRDQSKLINEILDENGIIYLVPTNDATAQEMLEKNSEQIKILCPKNPQRILIIPEDCKDLNDVLIKHGVEKIKYLYEHTYPIELYCVQRILKNESMVEVQYARVRNFCMKINNTMVLDDLCDFLSTEWCKSPESIKAYLMTKNTKDAVDVSHLKTMSMLIADYDKYITTLKENRINFGWAKTDAITRGMRMGDVIQMVASGGTGKTLWAENLITNLIKNYPDLPLMFFSLEQMGVMAFERFAMMEGQLESYQVEQWNNNPDVEIQKKIIHTIRMLAENYKNFVLTDEGGMTMAKLEQYVTHAGMTVFDRPVKIIVIDYLGYLQGEGKDLYHKVSAIAKELKELAKKLKCVIISLHQVSKAGKSGGNPIESHMVRDSGVIFESADIMISAWRPELKESITDAEKKDLEGVYITKIIKNRYGISGVQIEFMFVKRYLKLFEKRDEPIKIDEHGKIGN